MSLNNTKFFIPITKRNDEEQMVYGYASTPDLDSQGDIVSVEAVKKALEGYLKFPTIREMHKAKAVGTTKEAKVDKGGLFIGAKIVNKEAWEMVKEGVYRGFSIGGKALKKVGETIDEMLLTEISLVDRPANENAVITLFKRDGKVTNQEMEKIMQNAPQALTEAMKKYAVDCVECDAEELMHRELMDAEGILRAACELCWTRYYFNSQGKPIEQLDAAIEALKMLAVQLLTEAEYTKVDEVMGAIGKASGRQVKHVYDFMKVQSGRRIIQLQGGLMAKTADTKPVDEKETTTTTGVEKTKTETVVTPEGEQPAEVVTPETSTDSATPETPAPVVPEVPVTPEPTKEAGVESPTMQKLDAIADTLKGEAVEDEGKAGEESDTQKLDTPEMTKMAEVQKAQSAKIVQLEAVVEKMASIIESVVGRVTKVEETPAAPKTVHSYTVANPVLSKGEHSETSKRASEIRTRLVELTKIRETDLAKYQSDHQDEAFKLMDELGKLQ